MQYKPFDSQSPLLPKLIPFPSPTYKSLRSRPHITRKLERSHMAPSSFSKAVLPLLFALFLSVHYTFGEIICENLPQEICAFSVSSGGKRCLLEKYARDHGKVEYQCRTSEVLVERFTDHIEKDDCVKACGVDRSWVGISSDSLMEPQFTAKLCSSTCADNCPNIVDLYFNLAAGEGVFLPDLCEVQRSNPHRAIAELLSSGVAVGPATSDPSSSVSASAPIAMAASPASM